MKKLISLMLALIMVFSLATVVGAEEAASTASVNYAASQPISDAFTLTKNYNKDMNVTETLKFSVTHDYANPDKTDATKLIVNDVTVKNANSATINVSVPSYSVAGTYKYTIKEVAGDVQGMVYDTDTEIHAVIYVGYDNETTTPCLEVLNTELWILKENNEKANEYNNTVETGSITVKKNVTGDLADKNDQFWVRVTITADADKVIASDINFAGTEEHVVTAKGGNKVFEKMITAADEAFTISGIPVGAKVEVVEISAQNGTALKLGDEVTPANTSLGAYTVKSYTSNIIEDVANDSSTAVTVENVRNATIETGIVTDSAPYVILIAVCAVAAVAFVLKRRNAVEF